MSYQAYDIKSSITISIISLVKSKIAVQNFKKKILNFEFEFTPVKIPHIDKNLDKLFCWNFHPMLAKCRNCCGSWELELF